MKASPLFKRRVVVSENAFAEIVVWQLPRPIAGSAHAFKYRLAFIVDGVCLLRYDNEAGKGDHRHRGDVEEAYAFLSPRQLVADFMNDVRRWQDENRDA